MSIKTQNNIKSVNLTLLWNIHLPPILAQVQTWIYLAFIYHSGGDGAPTWHKDDDSVPRKSPACTVYDQYGHCISHNFNEENGTNHSQWDRPTPCL